MWPNTLSSIDIKAKKLNVKIAGIILLNEADTAGGIFSPKFIFKCLTLESLINNAVANKPI